MIRALRFEGQVKFRGGDATVELHAGDSVFVLPNEEREFSKLAEGQCFTLFGDVRKLPRASLGAVFLTNHS